MYKIKTFLLFMTSSYCSLLKVCFFSQWNFIEVSLTAAPNWDNKKKNPMAICGLQTHRVILNAYWNYSFQLFLACI